MVWDIERDKPQKAEAIAAGGGGDVDHANALHYAGTLAVFGGVFGDRWLNDVAFLSLFVGGQGTHRWHCTWDCPGEVEHEVGVDVAVGVGVAGGDKGGAVGAKRTIKKTTLKVRARCVALCLWGALVARKQRCGRIAHQMSSWLWPRAYLLSPAFHNWCIAGRMHLGMYICLCRPDALESGSLVVPAGSIPRTSTADLVLVWTPQVGSQRVDAFVQ